MSPFVSDLSVSHLTDIFETRLCLPASITGNHAYLNDDSDFKHTYFGFVFLTTKSLKYWREMQGNDYLQPFFGLIASTSRVHK